MAGDISIAGLSSDDGAESDDSEIAASVEASLEASVSLERDLHSYYAARVGEIEPDLILVENGIEYQTDAGRIDLLARDRSGSLVVIEFKAGKAKDDALGQLLGYMGCLSGSAAAVRGILVASSFDPRVVYASKGQLSVKLMRYQVSFATEEVQGVALATVKPHTT